MKDVKFGSELREELITGMNIVSRAVGATLGHKGQNAIFNKPWGVVVTNDGVSIAKELELDGFAGIGAQMLIEAARKTNDVAGDGTTTSIVIAEALVNEGAGCTENPIRIRQGINEAVSQVVAQLREKAKPVKDVKDIATVSSGDGAIGELLGEVFKKIGKDGAISVEDGPIGISVEYTDGFQIPYGFVSPYFASNGIEEKMETEVLVSKRKITLRELLPLMETISNKQLAIFCNDIEPDAVAQLAITNAKGLFKTMVVRVRDFDVLDDIAGLLNIPVVEHDEIKNAITEKAKLNVTQNRTTIIGGDPKERIEYLKKLKPDNDLEGAKLKERIAKLSGGACVIRIGATTDIELKEKKDRLEDAINASRAALEEGVVIGGGLALYGCDINYNGNDQEVQVGYNLVSIAIARPLMKIVQNADEDIDEFMKSVKDNNIYDPVKVTISALENAASVASSFLTTASAIYTDWKEEYAKAN